MMRTGTMLVAASAMLSMVAADDATCLQAINQMCSDSSMCGHGTHFNGCNTPGQCNACGVKYFSDGINTACTYVQMQNLCGVQAPAHNDEFITFGNLGKARGYSSPTATHKFFRGIPYAKPPVGDLRFRPPRDPEPWHGVWDATNFRATCSQLGPAWASIQGVSNSSEDCLYINLYIPRSPPPPGGYAMMMYLPAGQYMWGAGNDVENFEAPTTPEAQSVIYVTLGYRVGAFGFLALPELAARDASNSTGNYGMLDQRAGLRFLKQYGPSFGGNPNKIVLWGESAGATSVSTHLVMPGSQPFISKAIIESGAFNRWTYKTWDTAVANSRQVLKNIFEYTNDTRLCPGYTESSDILKCLLSVPAQNIVYPAGGGFGMAQSPPYVLPYGDLIDKCAWAPVIDGVELTDTPINLLKQGKVPKVPVIFGTNRDEGSTFTTYQTGHGDNAVTVDGMGHRWIYMANFTNKTSYLNWATPIWGADAAEQLATTYGPGGKIPAVTDWWWALSYTIGDFVLECWSRLAGDHMAQAGMTPYMYYFNHTPSVSINNDNPGAYGAFHGAEVPWVWYDDFELDPNEQVLSRNMVAYWASFAHHGNPNTAPLPAWPAYNSTSDTAIVFGDAPGAPFANITYIKGNHKDLCQYWIDNNLM
eukprot:TRINITY_DN2660_c0_g2_i1.p1 TRINITY_DN2660_c0_g2~~TRINITY_DN2660_c0_g2_i1.p1  ORF type:complete len:659 (+),score=188.29 TRINITY_DN2660_c0_g2_i1:43-1977(+)